MEKAEVLRAVQTIRALREDARRAEELGNNLNTAARVIGELLDKIERLETDCEALLTQRDYVQQKYLEALRAAHGGDEGCL